MKDNLMPLHTPWKKSRKYGDVYGGRKRAKFADNIFERAHSIKRPSVTDVLPIVMEDNPSRDFFFPLSGEEILEALKSLPKRDYCQRRSKDLPDGGVKVGHYGGQHKAVTGGVTHFLTSDYQYT